MSSALKGAFMRNWYRTEAVPLYGVTVIIIHHIFLIYLSL